MKVRSSIEGATNTVPRLVKTYGKEGAIEAAAAVNGKHSFGVVVDGDVKTFPRGTASTVEEALAKHGEIIADPAGPPSPYKGSWRVAFGLIDGRPLVELRRKMTAYASVLVTWDGKIWSWEVTREERWFAKGRASDKGAADSMERAIHTAVASLDKHVRDACVVQHLEKRTRHDEAWAATHPERAERAAKNLPAFGQPKKQRAAKRADALPTSSAPPSSSKSPRKARGTVIPARTDADRDADALYGPLVVTPLLDADEDKDAALMKMFAAAVDQAMSGAQA